MFILHNKELSAGRAVFVGGGGMGHLSFHARLARVPQQISVVIFLKDIARRDISKTIVRPAGSAPGHRRQLGRAGIVGVDDGIGGVGPGPIPVCGRAQCHRHIDLRHLVALNKPLVVGLRDTPHGDIAVAIV